MKCWKWTGLNQVAPWQRSTSGFHNIIYFTPRSPKNLNQRNNLELTQKELKEWWGTCCYPAYQNIRPEFGKIPQYISSKIYVAPASENGIVRVAMLICLRKREERSHLWHILLAWNRKLVPSTFNRELGSIAKNQKPFRALYYPFQCMTCKPAITAACKDHINSPFVIIIEGES